MNAFGIGGLNTIARVVPLEKAVCLPIVYITNAINSFLTTRLTQPAKWWPWREGADEEIYRNMARSALAHADALIAEC